MAVETLDELLAQREGKTLDFKRDLSSPRGVVKDIVAFANTSGGTLIIGVDDGRAVVGLDDPLGEEERLANLVADSIEPPVLPDIELAASGDKTVLIVRVAHWHGPFYVKSEGSENGVYVRLGSTSRRAGPEILAELRRAAANVAFDQEPAGGTNADDIDWERVRSSFAAADVEFDVDEEKLMSLDVLVRHGGSVALSNGGVLLYANDAVRRRTFPDAYVRCARFEGETKGTDIVDQLDLQSSTIIEAIDDVEQFIRRNTRTTGRVHDMRRRDLPEYSTTMLRELLVNAIAHADYSLSGMQTRVALYADRLEIESPGLMPFGMTLEQLKAGQSKVRNRVVARVFAELDLLEGWGRAWQFIRGEMERGYPEPQFEEPGTSLRVTLWPHPETRVGSAPPEEADSDTPRVATADASGLAAQERREVIFSLITSGEANTIPELVESLPSVGKRTIERDVARLRNDQRIRRAGAKKTGSYEAVPANQDGPSAR